MNQNQRNELHNHFRDHSYFRLCSAVHAVFQQYDSRIVLSREQLFVDAATTLDRLLTDDRKEILCHDLWSDMQDEYRTLEGNKTGQETTQVEVAMLCYAVMFGLTYVYDNRSFYRQRLGQTIHNRVHCMWRHCEAVESALPAAVNAYSEGMKAWMQDYFRSADSLTEEIGNIVKGDDAGGGADSVEADIPQDCKAAVDKVFTRGFTPKQSNGAVLHSQRQMMKAARTVALERNPQLAMLMRVGQEVGAVKAGCKPVDFVRALIGLRILPPMDQKTIKNKAVSLARIVNGYTKNGKTYKPLPYHHRQWSTKDQPVGEQIYQAMISEETMASES